jgi:PhnB protein
MKVRTYLNFSGNCAEALRFYEQTLGGKVKMMAKYSEMPGADKVPPAMQNMIMHARIDIGDAELMAADTPPEQSKPMQGFALALGLDSTEEAERVFKALSEGGQITMPMQETFFAFRFGILKDKFGTHWMVLHERPMERRG